MGCTFANCVKRGWASSDARRGDVFFEKCANWTWVVGTPKLREFGPSGLNPPPPLRPRTVVIKPAGEISRTLEQSGNLSSSVRTNDELGLITTASASS
jgi:hypothetical protein